MSETPTASQSPSKKSPWDRRIKTGFLVVTIALAIVIWLNQRQGPQLQWSKDLQSILRLAERENRRVLILFRGKFPNEETRNLIKMVLTSGDSTSAMQKGKFLCVQVELDNELQSAVAKKYSVKKLPTMIIMGSDGKELKRHVGYMALGEFFGTFLKRQ